MILEPLYKFNNELSISFLLKLLAYSFVIKISFYLIYKYSITLGYLCTCIMLLFIWFLKPFSKCKGNIYNFFAHIIYTSLIIVTIISIWLLIITAFNIISLQVSLAPIYIFFSLNTYDNTLDNLDSIPENNLKIEDDIGLKASTYNNKILLKKSYYYNQKVLPIIKPFPLIKFDYMECNALKNKFNLSSEKSDLTDLNKVSTNTTETNTISKTIYNDSIYSKNNISSHNSTISTSSGSSVVSDTNGNIIVIDLKVVKGLESNRDYWMVQDVNDPSLANLNSILKTPITDFKVNMDHYTIKECSNKKYMSSGDINKIHKIEKVHSNIRIDPHAEKSIILTLSDKAKANLLGNDPAIIVENNNKNCFYKESSTEGVIKIPISNPFDGESVKVLSTYHEKVCWDCYII